MVMGLGGEAWRGRFCKACREPAGRFVGGGRRQADKSPGTREGGRLGAWPDTSRRARPISWSRTPAPQTSRPAGVPAHKSSAHAGPPEAAPGAGKTPASADKPTDESSSALEVDHPIESQRFEGCDEGAFQVQRVGHQHIEKAASQAFDQLFHEGQPAGHFTFHRAFESAGPGEWRSAS